MTSHPRPAQAGFTLLEVLIALTLMAVLGILSWRALDSTTRSNERLEAHADDTIGLLRAFGQLESDLSHHAGTGILPSRPAADSPLSAVLPPGVDWAFPRLTLIRAAHTGEWQEVIWTLAGDTLLRAAGTPARSLPLPAAQNPEPMLTGVNDFRVRAWLPGQGWLDNVVGLSPQQAGGLEITLVRRQEVQGVYRKVVLLP